MNRTARQQASSLNCLKALREFSSHCEHLFFHSPAPARRLASKRLRTVFVCEFEIEAKRRKAARARGGKTETETEGGREIIIHEFIRKCERFISFGPSPLLVKATLNFHNLNFNALTYYKSEFRPSHSFEDVLLVRSWAKGLLQNVLFARRTHALLSPPNFDSKMHERPVLLSRSSSRRRFWR